VATLLLTFSKADYISRGSVATRLGCDGMFNDATEWRYEWRCIECIECSMSPVSERFSDEPISWRSHQHRLDVERQPDSVATGLHHIDHINTVTANTH